MASESTRESAPADARGNPAVEAWRRARSWVRVQVQGSGKPAAWELAAYGLLLATALSMRLWDLGSRAIHHDESLHALYSFNLSVGTGYAHDPMMHGPFQIEATAGLFYLFGDSDFTSRLLYALAGTVLVLMPVLLRARLGRLGAVLVSVMLAFSPAMLYFSRFARNDILMAVWTLGLVICLWRYLDEGRNRYLYAASALLALAFATKESSYIVTFTLGLYLLLAMAARSWPAVSRGIATGEVSPPAALARLAADGWSAARRGLRAARSTRRGAFFALLFTLSLPTGAAFVGWLHDSLFLGWTKLLFITPDPNDPRAIFNPGHPAYNKDLLDAAYENLNLTGLAGAPAGGAIVIAAVIVGVLMWIGAWLGLRWLRGVWWRTAAIFYGLWALLYTTFLSNPAGIPSGIWRSAGYWIAQEQMPVPRGDQPWYYFIAIASVYEFLPLILAVIAGIYYLKRDDLFGGFLAFWAGVTFLIYTVAAGEKMPWLLVNITLPLIVLAGKFVGDVAREIEWRRLTSGGGLLMLPGVPLFLVLSWRLALASVEDASALEIVVQAALLAALAAMPFLAFFLGRRTGYRNLASIATISLAVVLLALTLLTGWRASYRNGDVPVEMIVYTQTSPDLARLFREVDRAGETDTPILIDQTSGFSWPWAWYLRNYSQVSYSGPAIGVPNQSVLVLHSNNSLNDDEALAQGYSGRMRIAHRRWFPETYKGTTLGGFVRSIFDRGVWRKSLDYFLYRKLDGPVGSEDAYVYFSREFPVPFAPSE